jgi:hypothetical protein
MVCRAFGATIGTVISGPVPLADCHGGASWKENRILNFLAARQLRPDGATPEILQTRRGFVHALPHADQGGI